MTAQATGLRLLVIAAIAAALVAAMTVAPRPAGADGPDARSADQAGQKYATAVAKAKERRAAKLKSCKQKPTKAKRKACKKKANLAFKNAKAKAKAKRDKARQNGGSDKRHDGPSNPREQREELKDCVRDGGSVGECKSRGGPKG